MDRLTDIDETKVIVKYEGELIRVILRVASQNLIKDYVKSDVCAEKALAFATRIAELVDVDVDNRLGRTYTKVQRSDYQPT